MNQRSPLPDLFEQLFASQDEKQKFYAAYGRFMVAWADAEAELYKVLKVYAEVDDAIARAIFSGVRTRGMVDYIRAIAHNTDMPRDRLGDLDHVFAQMMAINTMRDTLAHYATEYPGYDYTYQDREGHFSFTNAERVTRYGNERYEWLTVQMIDAMSKDLAVINKRLNAHVVQAFADRFAPWRSPQPWLYKPPQPVSDRLWTPSVGRRRKVRSSQMDEAENLRRLLNTPPQPRQKPKAANAKKRKAAKKPRRR